MKMRWHIPKPRSGTQKFASGGHERRRYARVPASVDFNTSYCEWDDGSGGFVPELAVEDEIGDANEQRMLTGRIRVGWRLSIPLLIRIEREDDGSFVVSDDEFAVHGDGESRDQAIRDYAESLIEYYELLSSRSRGDEPTMKLFRRLQDYLKKVAD